MARFTLQSEVHVAAPVDQVWAYFSTLQALKDLTPPQQKLVISDTADFEVKEGALHVIRAKQFGIPLVWKARISNVEPERQFVDTAEQSPFKFWQHTHLFRSVDGTTVVEDKVEYELPLGPLGVFAHNLFVRKQLEQLFAHRRSVLANRFGLAPAAGPNGLSE